MRGAIGIAAELFELLDAPGLQGIGDGCSHTGVVLMHVDAFQLQGFAVQKKALFSVEGNVADTRRGRIDIHHLAVHLHRCLHLIEIRVCVAPEVRVRQLYHVLCHPRLLGLQGGHVSVGAGHFLSFGIQQSLFHLVLLSGEAAVGYLRLHMQQSHVVGLFQLRIDEGAEGCHTDLCRLLQPHVAVDACTLIEPALFERGVGTYADQIVLTIFYIRCDVVHLGHIAAGFGTHIEAVEPHLGISENTVETQHQPFAQILVADPDELTIPAHAALRIFPAYGLIAVRVTGFAGVG